MTHKNLIILFLYLTTKTQTYSTFAIQIPPNKKSCLKEWFPENESIAVNFNILSETENDYKQIKKKSKRYSSIVHTFLNENKELLGKVEKKKETWTFVTHKDEIITFCVDNKSVQNVIIEYNITTNIYNNDHSRVADKEHLKLYERDILDLEGLTEGLVSDNKIVVERARVRKIKISDLGGVVAEFSGICIFFVVVVKVCAIFYLRRKLYQKKIL